MIVHFSSFPHRSTSITGCCVVGTQATGSQRWAIIEPSTDNRNCALAAGRWFSSQAPSCPQALIDKNSHFLKGTNTPWKSASYHARLVRFIAARKQTATPRQQNVYLLTKLPGNKTLIQS
ncbi:hypothetical protein ACN1C3_31300 [Pseudomonas sp. H11T01]|uniref:hypothetical protein n=1 Tax=Pseudomonas sp. H11T01 TaxID=3402749 RepID=UPI003ABFE349